MKKNEKILKYKQEFVLSDGFKTLVSNYIKNETEENLIKVFTEFAMQINYNNKNIIAKSLELRAKELKIQQCVEAMNKAEEDGEIIKLLQEEEK